MVWYNKLLAYGIAWYCMVSYGILCYLYCIEFHDIACYWFRRAGCVSLLYFISYKIFVNRYWAVNVKSSKAMMWEVCARRGRNVKKSFPTFPRIPFFPDMRTMAGLAFLLSCQRLHTKKFPLLAILHSIKSLTTILCMLGKIHKSINKVSFLQNLSKPLFRLFHLLS